LTSLAMFLAGLFGEPHEAGNHCKQAHTDTGSLGEGVSG